MSPTCSLGQIWFDALATTDSAESGCASVRVGEITLDSSSDSALVIAVVPDPDSPYPRVRHGEIGLREGWSVADAVTRYTAAQQHRPRADRAPVVLVIDTPGQAYGYLEELIGLHQALAAAVDALAHARLAGHPVVGLIVGKAISGGFLSFGLQANRLVALDHSDVEVQVMSQSATARITRRDVAELERIAAVAPATARDVGSFASLGALHELLKVEQPHRPTDADIDAVRTSIAAAIRAAREAPADLTSRLTSPEARARRAASNEVRRRVAQAWRA
ncbi:biotin-independent malonate decarboxylase subunit gamma [Gordonia sp. CPCC 205515]|uniref:biotin-independent malonate decarboxylase subunit gamma n=1 Tax=Gordonia sp. CPCC 205515 TaxID=3140791 RepID=UPI003AF3BC61